ncbi:signal transduction histidine kinase, nitrogen specific, NtrB [Denitrovibrio acetiphilus DSM 12809]|uniref:histidine kinase n=1 Tax=Denitrovibrio acetiphilus (strain DSM 12809 / NBRC 114555 / N2460) TaxID=522772 RepID=D4H5K0_DENA2|nr:HAMP domain-containing sensor histidine kinase [Denitrovibrio acetiphilus]ADD67620.1 signal transduction histidine kinase, nitrogen specific, NtrB [Denitrovibrio acetiphilus DSM 12809]
MPDCNFSNLRSAYFEISGGKITDMNNAGEKFLQTGIEAGIKNFKRFILEHINAGQNTIKLQHRLFGIKTIEPGPPVRRVLIINVDEFRPNLEELFDISSFQHEMKNPLTVIDGTSQLILAKSSDEYIRKCAGIILNETERIKHIMQNIRMLSEMEIEYSEFNILAFLEELKDSLYVLFPDIKLSVQIEPSLENIIADRKKLFMAVNNLIKNACEAQKTGQISLYLSIDPTIKYINKKENWALPMLKISIIDNGPGITEEILNRLFTPFFSTKNRGTGLGLVIAKEITEKHKGRIEVSSTPGTGTSFMIYIPMMPTDLLT